MDLMIITQITNLVIILIGLLQNTILTTKREPAGMQKKLWNLVIHLIKSSIFNVDGLRI